MHRDSCVYIVNATSEDIRASCLFELLLEGFLIFILFTLCRFNLYAIQVSIDHGDDVGATWFPESDEVSSVCFERTAVITPTEYLPVPEIFENRTYNVGFTTHIFVLEWISSRRAYSNHVWDIGKGLRLSSFARLATRSILWLIVCTVDGVGWLLRGALRTPVLSQTLPVDFSLDIGARDAIARTSYHKPHIRPYEGHPLEYHVPSWGS